MGWFKKSIECEWNGVNQAQFASRFQWMSSWHYESGRAIAGAMPRERLRRIVRRSWMCAAFGALSACCFVGRTACAQAGSEVVPGIWNYEVVLPAFPLDPEGGAGLLSSSENGARDLSDTGLVVGRVATEHSQQRAFVYSLAAQFGLSPGAVTWLPMPIDSSGAPFATAEALDVNEHGTVAGNAGSTLGFSRSGISAWQTLGALWRLGGEANDGATCQLFEPPNSLPHGTWPQVLGGYTAFTSISAELPLRVVGYAGSTWGCVGSGGCFSGSRPVAFTVDISSTGVTTYRTEPLARPDALMCPRKGRAMGVSRQGHFVVGAQNTIPFCEHGPVQFTHRCSPTVWDPVESEDLAASDIGAAVFDDEGTVCSEVTSVSARDDGRGIAVGYALSPISDTAIPVPHAWLLPSSGSTHAVEPVLLPTSGIGGFVNDIERALWLVRTGEASRIAVGTGLGSIPSGALWYWDAAGWGEANWHVLDVNTPAVLSDLWRQQGITISALHGVNQRGDCVGEALVSNGQGSVVQRPVILRAVHLPGDLDWNGCVGAGDLAILLASWCDPTQCASPNPATDLDRDGFVSAPDLAILLSRWSCTSAAGDSPVPLTIAEAAKASVDFAAMYVGLTDIEGYRAWARTAPAPLREFVDSIMWSLVKNGE